MAELKSKFEVILERLSKEGKKISIIEEKKKDEIVKAVEKELDEYRFLNQKRIKESQEQIATVVLTS